MIVFELFLREIPDSDVITSWNKKRRWSKLHLR